MKKRKKIKEREKHLTYYCQECDSTIREEELSSGMNRCLECDSIYDPKTIRLGGKPLSVEFNRDGKYVIPRVKNLGTGENRIYGAWMPEVKKRGLSVYYSCLFCGTINDVSDLRISPGGAGTCFYCGGCSCDNHIVFGGWNQYRDMPRKKMNRDCVFERGMVYTD